MDFIVLNIGLFKEVYKEINKKYIKFFIEFKFKREFLGSSILEEFSLSLSHK